MVKNVEPLVTNSDSEEKVVRVVAKLLIGSLVIAGIVAGARTCENSIDNLREIDKGLTNHLK